MGNNFHDPKRYNEQNNHQKLNQQNLGLKQNQRKNKWNSITTIYQEKISQKRT